MARLSTVFFGTPELAVPALNTLAEVTDLRLVVTQPDRPAGRGRQLRSPPVKQRAEQLAVPVWQPERLAQAELHPALYDIDCFVVLAYGEIMRQAVLDLPRLDCINLHASLLPRWRGASPLQAALAAGDQRTGVTVMGMVPALDAGPMYLQHEIALDETSTLPWLHDEMATCAATALADFLDQASQQWPLANHKQDPAAVTWCHKLTSEHGHLDVQQAATDLARLVRAYTPAPGCWLADEQGRRHRIWQAEAVSDSAFSQAAPGEVVVRGDQLAMGTGRGALSIQRWQPAGSKAMEIGDWLRGHSAPGRLS